ncbi:hypothetical protein MBLNU230_g4027t1 [Neophaeotheca triangularis]
MAATPGPNGETRHDLNHLSPSLLYDKEGNSIVPTTVPPAITFDDYSSNAVPERRSEDAGASYFDAKPAHAGRIEREEETSDTESIESVYATPGAFAENARPPPQRAGTAPIDSRRPRARDWNTERPKPSIKRGSLLGGKRRVASADQQRRAPYSYQFDPVSSSSDSSSSEEEGKGAAQEAGKTKKTKKQQQQQGGARNGDKGPRRGSDAPYSKFKVGNEHFSTKGKVSKKDGRLNISVNETENSGYISKALGQTLKHHLNVPKRSKKEIDRKKSADDMSAIREEKESQEIDSDAESIAKSLHTQVTRPKMNIVVMVIGSRGDIQPFLKVGKILKQDYGHRVRIATHPAFRDFVEKDQGLEFFSVGGDPSELMAFMVKNPGLIPNMETVRAGEIPRRRAAMAEMFEGFWRACVNATDDEKDVENIRLIGKKHPFVADAIIANPPSFAHVHIAERLGIPLHMMFTFPYSPTQAFPHPLANIKPQKSNVDKGYVNFMSYPLVEMMTWQGLGDIANRFRENTLGLEPVSSLWAPGALYRMKVPYTYMWSPSLVPKPEDWGPEIDLSGFVFLDLASNFQPPQELTDFLDAGDPPIYIGFGSIVVDDPEAFTEMIFKAVELAGVRALVNKGWGGLGGENTPENIHMLGNTPHDWLFPKCKAVVHHGGAGTTAIGLKLGKPTMIVPFFGDQPFWGAMVAEAKAGAHECIPYKKLNAERLAEGIKQCMLPESQENVKKIAESIENEGDGAENAVKSFHRSLPLSGSHNMRCSILEDRVAVWQLKRSSLRLSALAADLLVAKGKIKWNDLLLMRHYEWNDFDGPGEPISGGAMAVGNSLFDMGKGVGMVPMRVAKTIKKREEHEKKKEAARQRREERRRKRETVRQVKKDEKTNAQAGTIDDGNTNDMAQQQQQREAEQQKQQQQQDQQQSGDPQRQNPQRPALPTGNTSMTTGSFMSADPEEPVAQEVAEDVGKGFGQTGLALLNMPNDLHMAIAQGFHNAPRLWGDATVRKPVRITGMRSGLVAARNEFGYGVYDGVTGIVTQPVGGWKDGVGVGDKFLGFGKGVGKGVGGFVLKDISAIVAPPAFVWKGLRKHVQKRTGGPGTNLFIRRAHIVQGQKDVHALEVQRDGEREEQLRRIRDLVDEGWRTYEEIWDQASYHRTHGGFLSRWKLDREKKRWEANGALENVGTADRALAARKRGEDLDRLFRKRRQEMREAEKPRAGAMEQPETFEEAPDALPNGRKVEGVEKQDKGMSTFPKGVPEGEEVKDVVGDKEIEEEGVQGSAGGPNGEGEEEEDGMGSESTAVATPEERQGEGKGKEKEKGQGGDRIQFAGEKIGKGPGGPPNAALAGKGMVSA